MTTRTRWAVAAGSAGVAAGLALGVTGFATAASPSPSPSTDRPLHQQGALRDRLMDHLRGGSGLVSAVTSDSLTLRTPDGTRTIGLTSSTTYYTGRTKATKDAVKAGSVVHVRLVDPRATKQVAAVVTVEPAHLDGWVTAVSGGAITLTDPSGFTRTVRTSSATTYVKDGAAATSSIVSVGTFVRAVGTVDADGTTLDATRVATGHPARGEGPAGGPGPGMMRDGGPGPAMMDGPTA
jgi:hypothetical protein